MEPETDETPAPTEEAPAPEQPVEAAEPPQKMPLDCPLCSQQINHAGPHV